MSFSTYERAAAQILIAMLRENPVRTVRREDFRNRWYVRYPHHRVTRRPRGQGEVVRGLGAASSNNLGYVGKHHMNEALRKLSGAGVLSRTRDTLTVVDVPTLVRAADRARAS